MFESFEPYQPRPAALLQGGTLAILVLLGVVMAIGHGGNVRQFLVGSRRPASGYLSVSRASMGGANLGATVGVGPAAEDPLLPFARGYFNIIHVLPALDYDQDLIISPWEMITAPAALRSLDLNRDGALSPEECGYQPRAEGPPDVIARARREFMRVNPVLAALDTDGDGEISAAEITHASASLQQLDRNGDGSLTPAEYLPDRAESLTGMTMSRFDRNGDGVLSAAEQAAEDAAPLRELLKSADRNRAGVVTREELLLELRRRVEAQRQLERARHTLEVHR